MNEMRARLPRLADPNELPFRARGGHHTRSDAFGDAVLSYGVTLSVRSLEVPHDSHELLGRLRAFLTALPVRESKGSQA